MQAFMSFDISMIPTGATIQEAFIDISKYDVWGVPFGGLGGLGIFHHQYDKLDKEDYVGTFTGINMMTSYSPPYIPYSSNLLNKAIQEQVDSGSPRFQIRIQFENPIFYHSQSDYLSFYPGTGKLTITYK